MGRFAAFVVLLPIVMSHPSRSAPVCTRLLNRGTHFTVEIGVGTPMQKFDVVADTGSDAIIVPSCTCVQAGYCSNLSRCFTGTNFSSTFQIQQGPGGPPRIKMVFGSGPIEAVVASDVVHVGALEQRMEQAVLLMTDQLLNIQGKFEGILGLGLPTNGAKKALYARARQGEGDGSEEEMGVTDSSSSDPDSGSDSITIRGRPAPTGAQGLHHPQPPTTRNLIIPPQDEGISLSPFHTRHIEPSVEQVDILPFPAGYMGGIGIEEGAFELLPDVGTRFHSEARQPTTPARRSLLQVRSEGSMQKVPEERTVLPPRPSNARMQQQGVSTPLHAGHYSDPQVGNNASIVVRGFMEEANINRFSMCFNDGASGVLRLGTEAVPDSHGSVGEVHWGLNFGGVSVGSSEVTAAFCRPEEMRPDQISPCGVIPDSGTTAIMGPKDHILQLYDVICSNWERCRRNHTAMVDAAKAASAAAEKEWSLDPFSIKAVTKPMIFQLLMLDCLSWLTEEEGINELPDLHFHIGGSHNTSQVLTLDGWSYIIETEEKEYEIQLSNNSGEAPTKSFTGKTRKVCSPAFSEMNYTTERNGPVWILGTPLFYKYRVGYDLSTTPPSMSFGEEPCGTCDDKTSLLSAADGVLHAGQDSAEGGAASESSSEAHRSIRRNRQLRQVLGPLRMPTINPSVPL